MSKKLLITLLVLVSIVFAGCHEQAGETDDGAMNGDDGTGDGGDNGMGDGGSQVPTITFSDIQAPTTVAAGENFTVTYTVSVDGTYTTQHIGAHWSTSSTANADTTTLAPKDFEGGSPHNTTGVELPTTYTIEGWNFQQAGTYYFRPHFQLEIDGGKHDFWGDEQTITVTA